MVKFSGVPTQPLAVGVTVIVATTGAMPGFVAVKDGILPLPLAGSPIDGSLFAQAKVVPPTGLVKPIAVVVAPLQYATLATGLTVAVGFTVIVNVSGVPGQLLAVGVTVIVATTGATPRFVAVKDGILPLPLAASPMPGSLFVHAKEVPDTGLVSGIAAVVAPLQ